MSELQGDQFCGEEGDGCLDVGDGGVVCVHLLDSGAFRSSVLEAPTMSFWTLEMYSSASRRIGMSEAAVVHVREGKGEAERLREKMP